MKKFLFYHLPAIAYGAAIILLSSISSLKLPELGILRADKLLHFLEYAIFAILIFRSFSELLRKYKMRYVMIFSFFFLLLFAALDEFYQRYIPGRHSDLSDLLIDILGASLILCLLWLLRHRLNQKAPEKA